MSAENNALNAHRDTVLSTRVRISRNIDSIPFPVRLNPVERLNINRRVYSLLKNSISGLSFTEMSSLYPYEAVSLAERHLISPEFASQSEGRALITDSRETVSIMLCEKDHIKIQGFSDGLDTETAYENAVFYDDFLNSQLHFAFDSKLGYLNQSPADLGTGMKVSVLMHLPALSKTGTMEKLSATAGKLGIVIRGSYGDAASVKGDIFRISNVVTMGISEAEALDNLKSFALQLATRERRTAESFIEDINIRDRINRSAGLIENAVLMSIDEMMELLSWVRLGALYGLNTADPSKIAALYTSMQPATLSVLAGRKLSQGEREELRAVTVRKIFE